MNVGGVILLLLITVALWVLYHKIFDVYYFDTIGGLGKEFIVCFILSFIVLAILKKIGKVLLIIFVIGIAIAVVLALLGILGNKVTSETEEGDSKPSDDTSTSEAKNETSSESATAETEVGKQAKILSTEPEVAENN